MAKETMTSRQRVLAALNHQETDRIPIDLGGNQTGIHKVAYAKLIKHLGIPDDLVIMDAVQQLAKPCESLLERFHVDTRYIAAGAAAGFDGRIVTRERDGRIWHDLTDEFGITWSMPDDQQLYMDISHHPLANATIADLASYPFPRGDDPARFAGLREQALRDPQRDALCGGQRHFRRRLRDLLVPARLAAMVDGHHDATGVLRGAARLHPEILDGLVPSVPPGSRRRGRRDHDRG